MPKVEERYIPCHLAIDTFDTRFMVMAPGGENPRNDIDPAKSKVGIRIKRSSSLRDKIDQYREDFFPHETKKVLGSRQPSSRYRNAFGARWFQPHISILRPDSGIQHLTEVGESFRDFVPEIYFDRFIVQTRKNF